MRPAQTTARVAMSLRNMVMSPSSSCYGPPGPTPAVAPGAVGLVRPLELKEIRMWPGCREQRQDAPAEAWDAQRGQGRRQGEEQQSRPDTGSTGPGDPKAGSRRLGGREPG